MREREHLYQRGQVQQRPTCAKHLAKGLLCSLMVSEAEENRTRHDGTPKPMMIEVGATSC
jgi:hypothetical protein